MLENFNIESIKLKIVGNLFDVFIKCFSVRTNGIAVKIGTGVLNK